MSEKLVISISGPRAAGKTTLAAIIADHLSKIGYNVNHSLRFEGVNPVDRNHSFHYGRAMQEIKDGLKYNQLRPGDVTVTEVIDTK